MRVRTIAVLLALCLLTGCSSGSRKSNHDSGETDALTIPAMPEGEPLETGAVVETEDVSSFFIESIGIKEDLRPQNPDTYYTYIPADPGKKFVDVCFSYRNLRTEEVNAARQFTAELFASGQYCYEGRMRPEKGDRSEVYSFDSMTVVPLGTAYIHCIFEIPDAVAEDLCELIAFIKAEGKTYSVTVREGGRGALELAPKDAVEKPSGTIEKGETVLLKNVCTFRVEDAQIAQEVHPPKHTDFQFYLKADDGTVYVDVCTSYMNLGAEETVIRDTVTAKMTYAGKYNYTPITVRESADGERLNQSSYIFVSPFCTERVHYLFKVPEEIAGSGDPIEVTFEIGSNEYTLNVR